MVELLQIKPERIEQESFRIIEAEFEQQTGRKIDDFSTQEFAVIRRVIHATADFSLADTMYFTEDSINIAIRSLMSGRTIYCDVSMAASGISKVLAAKFQNTILTMVHDPEIIKRAKELGVTRSEAAVDALSDRNAGIIVVGNAPTALIRVIQAVKDGRLNPDLVIGVPVGFVNAEESKELLVESGINAIICRGRRGGSPIAAAIVNALLKIAVQSTTD